jgi:hypothetical protein
MSALGQFWLYCARKDRGGEWHDGIVSSLMAWFKCLRHNQGIVHHLCRKQAAQWLLLAAIKRELAIDSCTEISPIQCHPSLPRGWWVVMHMPLHNVIVLGCDKDCVTLSFFFTHFSFFNSYLIILSAAFPKVTREKKKQLIRLIGPRLESETQGPDEKTWIKRRWKKTQDEFLLMFFSFFKIKEIRESLKLTTLKLKALYYNHFK